MVNSEDKFQKIRDYDWKKLFFELVVVFLGVTAGFLLNSWRLDKQNELLEKKYMDGFLQDVNTNIKELETAVESDSLWLNRAKPKLVTIQKGTITVDSANSVIKLIVEISKAGTQTGTYEDITNSGNLNIIGDYNLKKQIVDYHVAISGVEFVEDYFYHYFTDFVMPFVFANFSVLTGKLNKPEVINTNQFANVIAGYFSLVQQRKSAYEGLLKKSYSLRDELKKLDLNSDDK